MNKFLLVITLVGFIFINAFGHNPDIQSLLKEGKENASKGDYKKAIESFSAVIEIDPNHVEALICRASAYRLSGNSFSAMIDYDAAIKANSQSFRAYLERADLKSSLGLDDEAIADYGRVIELQPDNFEALHKRGLLRNIYEDYYGALEDFSTCLKLNPSAELYYLTALLEFKLGNDEECIQLLNKALKKESANYKFFLARGNAYLRMAKYSDAIKDFDKAHQLKPEDAEVLFKRSLAKRYSLQWHAALEDINLAIELSDQHVQYLENRISINRLLKDYGGVIADLNKILSMDSTNLNGFLLIADISAEDNQPEEAIKYYSKYIELNPGNFSIYYKRGLVRMETGSYASAFEDFKLSLDLNPDYEKGYYFSALVLQKLDKEDEACQMIKKAIELGSNEALNLIKQVCE